MHARGGGSDLFGYVCPGLHQPHMHAASPEPHAAGSAPAVAEQQLLAQCTYWAGQAHGQGAQMGVNGTGSETALCLKPLPPAAAARACIGLEQSASFKAPRHAVSASAATLYCRVAPALTPPLSLMRHAPSATVSGVGGGPGGRISSNTPRGAPCALVLPALLTVTSAAPAVICRMVVLVAFMPVQAEAWEGAGAAAARSLAGGAVAMMDLMAGLSSSGPPSVIKGRGATDEKH